MGGDEAEPSLLRLLPSPLPHLEGSPEAPPDLTSALAKRGPSQEGSAILPSMLGEGTDPPTFREIATGVVVVLTGILGWLGVRRKRVPSPKPIPDPESYLAPEDRTRHVTQREWHDLKNKVSVGGLGAEVAQRTSDRLEAHIADAQRGYERLARLEVRQDQMDRTLGRLEGLLGGERWEKGRTR